MLTLFINQNESNILQVYFLIFEFHFLILDLNCEKVSVYLSQEAVIPKFLDLSNLNFQGICELISLLIQQNLGCFLIDAYVVYLAESIS